MPTGSDAEVLVVIGLGEIGVEIARRCARDRVVVVGDIDPGRVRSAVGALEADGITVHGSTVDVTSRESVSFFAAVTSGLGQVGSLAHTAGISVVQGSLQSIVDVDLVGTAIVLDAFSTVIRPGGAAVVIASMAGHIFGGMLSIAQERFLRDAAPDELRAADWLTLVDEKTAYGLCKRANQLRVQSLATEWGQERGIRLNSVSPGLIDTDQGRAELAGEHGDRIRSLVARSSMGRPGTAGEVAGIVDFLLSPEAALVTGTDVLADGGVMASLSG